MNYKNEWNFMAETHQCINTERKDSVQFSSVQFSHSVVSNSCDPMNRSMPGLPVHHQLPEFTQTHVHRVSEPPSHLTLCRSLLLLPQSLPASGSFPMSQLFT